MFLLRDFPINSIFMEELVLLMTTLRRMYTKNKPELVQQLNVPEFDDEFFKLVLFALDDDSSNTVEINEWKRWIYCYYCYCCCCYLI